MISGQMGQPAASMRDSTIDHSFAYDAPNVNPSADARL